MDFAITPVCRADGHRAYLQPGAVRQLPEATSEWVVLCLHTRRGVEVAQHLAQFGHRSHAEAFLADLLACRAAAPPVPLSRDGLR